MTLVEHVSRVSTISPTASSFRYGVSLINLQRTNPLADTVDLLNLTTEDAEAVLCELWEVGCYNLIQDRELAVEVFSFAMVFGEDVAGWLLHEAGGGNVDKSYEMHQPDPEFHWDDLVLSKVGRVLPMFRMLQASYIGWLNRTIYDHY